MPLSVRLFEETLGSDEATTKRATLLWSRIEKFAIDIKGVSGDALERLKLLVLCIAAITLQYDKQEEAFSELLNATFGSSGELRGKKLPQTFIEYREAELRAKPPRGFFDTSIATGLHRRVSPDKLQKIKIDAKKLTDLWEALVFCSFADIFILPILFVGDDVEGPLENAIMSDDFLSPKGLALFEEIGRSDIVKSSGVSLDRAMVAYAVKVRTTILNNPNEVGNVSTQVCFYALFIGGKTSADKWSSYFGTTSGSFRSGLRC